MNCAECGTPLWEIVDSNRGMWCPTCEKWWWEVIMLNEFPGPAIIPHAAIKKDYE